MFDQYTFASLMHAELHPLFERWNSQRDAFLAESRKVPTMN